MLRKTELLGEQRCGQARQGRTPSRLLRKRTSAPHRKMSARREPGQGGIGGSIESQPLCGRSISAFGRPSLSAGVHTSPRVLAVTIGVNRHSRCFCTTTRVYLCAAITATHKTPKDIARSLRAFQTHTDSDCCAASEFHPGSTPAKQRYHKKECNTSAMLCRACHLLKMHARSM
jgi:hypothetical protein